MAAVAKQCFAFFLLAALCFSVQIQARESQFFNKVPSNNADRDAEIIAAADALAAGPSAEPTFVPENENGGYGLYGHNAGQLPPTTTKATKTTTPKYLPKNYNVDAYVTVPEGYRGAQENDGAAAATTNAAAEFDNNKNPNFYNSEKEQTFGETSLYSNGNFYNSNTKRDSNADSDSDDASDSDDFPENTNFYDGQKETNFYKENNDENQDPNVRSNEPFNSKKNFNMYGNAGEPKQTEPYFNSKKGFNLYGNSGKQQSSYNGGLEESKFADSSKYNSFESSNNGGSGVQKQGMSDTRFLENGKYFYDVNMEQQKYSRNYNRPAYSNNYNKYYQGQEQDLP